MDLIPNPHDDLRGRVFLVTGGTSGMGLATARQLLGAGGHVVITGRDDERLQRAGEQLADAPRGGARLLSVRADAASRADTERVRTLVRREHGHLDGVFANAGVGVLKTLAQTTEEDFDRLVGVNLKGVFLTVQQAAPLREGTGSVVVNASWTLHRAMAGAPLHAATEAAVHNLARSLSADLARRGIRANSVSPGYVHTGMYDALITDETGREATRTAPLLQRVGRAGEVAEAVVFLLSNRASCITGQDLVVDGGLVVEVAA